MSDRQQIIEETYIKPIRSVIAVDDEFPMLDKLLDNPIQDSEDVVLFSWQSQAKQKAENARQLAKHMNDWRARRWIVDVHDGTGMGPKSDGKLDIQHLHQSDLVVLDYELRPKDHGEKSMAILQRLAKNPHFNLVIIYSKNPVIEVFRNVRRVLLRTVTSFSGDQHDLIGKEWTEWSEEDASPAARIYNQIVDEDVYVLCSDLSRRESNEFPWRSIKDIPIIRANLAEIGMWCRGKSFDSRDVIKWLLNEFERKTDIPTDSDEPVGDLSWSMNPTPELNWVRSDRIFITVVSKRENEDVDLIDRLKLALCDWSPTPVRLIVSQIRASMEEYGGVIEDAALSEKMTQAGWLHQILSTKNKSELKFRLSTMLERQTTALYKKLESRVLPAAEGVIAAERARNWGPDRTIDHHFDLGLTIPGSNKDQIMRSVFQSLNTYECSIPVYGQNLTTGHILDHDGHYWICVSPSCDLVPEQRKGEDSWRQFIGTNLMPIKVVKLWPETSLANALDRVSDGQQLFIQARGELTVLKFTRSVGDNPIWEQWFAKSEGKFRGGSPEVSILRLTKGIPTARAKSKKKPHLAEHRGVEVVAQLRYEYALNILHRMGANLSRVGLDFVEYEAE